MNATSTARMTPDFDEVAEWIEAFDQIVKQDGSGHGTALLDALTNHAREVGVDVPTKLNTPYKNTIPVEDEVPYPGDRALERRIKSLIRWNAMAMVHRQNKEDAGIAPHLDLFVLGVAARSRLQSLLPCQVWRRARGLCLLPGPCLARRLFAGVS
jgi:pyruvate dehydrogenase complex dehydrogenase (E1) component